MCRESRLDVVDANVACVTHCHHEMVLLGSLLAQFIHSCTLSKILLCFGDPDGVRSLKMTVLRWAP